MTLGHATTDIRTAALPAISSPPQPIVADGRHNAFAAFTFWQGRYWLAYRQGSGHTARDGDLVVLASPDAHTWEEVVRFDTGGDDRDAQWAVFDGCLWLYFNSLEDRIFRIFVSCTKDGRAWSPPQTAYEEGFILWKPVVHDGRLYAGAHRPGTDDHRLAHLVTSADGFDWQYVSTIRAGTGESETALHFDAAGKLTAFLRDQTKIGGAILEADPPYNVWTQRPAGVHLSGQAIYTFDGVTYLLSRVFACDPPLVGDAPRAALPPQPDQGTLVYTYEEGTLRPYCLLGPLAGNHDSSYATAVRQSDEMLVVFHRSKHPYAGAHRIQDAANLFLARVPLKAS